MISAMEGLINAKYHVSVAKRMYEHYFEYPEKRFLVGVIKEMAKASRELIKAYLVKTKKKRYKDFVNVVSKQYLDKETREHLLKSLEIERAHTQTPVSFAKGNNIIMLIEGKYRILTVERIGEFLVSVEQAIKAFPNKT